MSQQKKLKEKRHQQELRDLHVELVHLQEGVKRTGAKVRIVFVGRDTAGKGGTIKAITERVSPRAFHVIAGLTGRRRHTRPVTPAVAPSSCRAERSSATRSGGLGSAGPG